MPYSFFRFEYCISQLINLARKFHIMKKIFYLLLLFSLGAKAQQPRAQPVNNRLKELVTSLDSFRNKAHVEKVHIHFDKPYYSVSDTIWLKAYVVNQTNELSTFSNVLYVDLVDNQNQVKTSLRLPLFQGIGWGTITLTDSLFQAGDYHIHAYTNWMRNFGNDYIFDKSIKIGNAMAFKKVETNNNVSANEPTDVSVQFFPEGGNLVSNIPSTVAFKAIGTNGLSKEISGYVVDKANKQVATFRSEHSGMGIFTLQPLAGNTYTAIIKYNNGDEKRVGIPGALQQGYILSVTQDDDNVLVKVNVSGGLMQNGKILLVAQANNIVQYAAEKSLISTGFSTIISKSRFPAGILQFTLFSPDYKPVAERLVFIRHDDAHLKITINPNKPTYKQRDKVHLDLLVTDNAGSPVTGSFSMSVTDESKVVFKEEEETTIFSNLLLTSELKGYIEYPNYYFTERTMDKARQLDNLLLTQGWRRFIWKDVLVNNFQAFNYKEETGIGISGTVSDRSGNPAAGARVSVLLNSGAALLDTVTNANGQFMFDNLILKKGTSFNLTAVDAKGRKNVKVELDKQVPDPVAFDDLPIQQPVNNGLATYLKNDRDRLYELNKYGMLERSILLKEVSIKDAALKNSASLAGAGHADQVLTFMDLLGCQQDFTSCLRGRLTNVHFVHDTLGNWTPYARNFDFPMLIVVDGIVGRHLEDVVAPDVASVEVLRGGGATALYGMKAGNGVIIITTKKGDVDYRAYEDSRYNNDSRSGGLAKYKFTGGYDLRRQFYMPDYDNPATIKQMADLRSTIYWNPNIMATENGKASVDFFNADGVGNYRVIIEGLDLQGRLARQVYYYKVN